MATRKKTTTRKPAKAPEPAKARGLKSVAFVLVVTPFQWELVFQPQRNGYVKLGPLAVGWSV